MKTCGTCFASLPDQSFSKRAASRDGLAARCKGCAAKYAREHYGGRKSAGLTQRTDLMRERDRERARVNPQRIRDKNAQAYQRNREANVARAAAWRASNSERHKAQYKSWVSRNYQQKLDLEHRRRVRLAGQYTERIDRIRVFERDDWKCQICGRDVDAQLTGHHPMAKSLDHVIPVSLGGEHSYRNVQLAHFGCNSSKGARLTVRR